MLLTIVVATFMIFITTAIHAAAMTASIRLAYPRHHGRLLKWHETNVFRVSSIVVFMFFVSLIESLIWAAPYVLFGVIETFEQAAYFSMVTYTTLGYGDIVVSAEYWRLLASFEAANGIIMFGWTTAIVMANIRHVYFGDTTFDQKTKRKSGE